MKKFILFSALLCITLISTAQITKGSLFLGGTVSGNANEQKDDNQTSETENSQWVVGIDFGKFVADNKAVGFFFDYYGNSSKNKYGNFPVTSYKTEGNGIGGGIFYRQYFSIGSKWFLFGEASLGYHRFESENETNDKLTSKGKGWSIDLGVTPGISFAAGGEIIYRVFFYQPSYTELRRVRYRSNGK